MIPNEIRNLRDNPCLDRKPIMRDCPDCREYCKFIPCETCGGTGEVEMTEDEIQDMKDSIEFEHDE